LTLNEDQDDQTIARWVTVDPPFSGQFSPVAERGGSRLTRAGGRLRGRPTAVLRGTACITGPPWWA
ncbi:hypothetical protein, partial [Kitasatospora sp. NPDC085879]|uniref:hypothetical protein n=1 Tax=Kitasatospora sp. NPDC085879 TaxID=3154769 RepID=UPI0034360E77